MVKGLKQISEKLDIPVSDKVWVNPLQLASNYEFERGDYLNDYRKRAVKRVIKSNLPFSSESNTQFCLVKQLITVTCPYCSKKMKNEGGGGNGSTFSHGFTCRCGSQVSLTMLHDGISISPKED